MLICGTGSFSREDEDENEGYNSPCRTPKRPKKITNFCKILGKDNTNNNKNPYANRGLDKFYALLEDLNDKKQKIYTQKGSEDISFVRFVYTNGSDRAKPVVVKAKGEKVAPKLIKQSTMDNDHQSNKSIEVSKEGQKGMKKRYSLRCSESFKMENLRRPCCYFPVMVLLILMFMAIQGRSFAILCTSIGWYLVPGIVAASQRDDASIDRRQLKRKKEYVRKKIIVNNTISEREGASSSPTSVINGQTPCKRSW